MAILDGDIPPTESAVIGESKNDPDRLLLLGENGAYYAYSVSDDVMAQVEPDDSWEIEDIDSGSLFV